jgi:4-hydroxybenzoate polyprenyltransferase
MIAALLSHDKKLYAYLCLIRPANIATAFADILLGFAIASLWVNLSFHMIVQLFLLLLTTACLYAGGIAFNDICDLELDKIERPDRLLVRGIISKKEAIVFTCIVFVLSIIFSTLVSIESGVITSIIVLLCLLYDAYAKPRFWIGPITMGLCRAFNLLLGLSILPDAFIYFWPLAGIPLLYITAVTLVSKGEVYGSSKKLLILALFFYLITFLCVILLTLHVSFYFYRTAIFLAIFVFINLPPLLKSIKTLSAKDIKKSVKLGVLDEIALDASIAAGFAGIPYGVIILLLLPLAIILAQRFSIT